MARVAKPEDAAEMRKRLLRGAYAAIAEHGFGAVTLQDVADQAGVSKALALYYFKNKEQLLVAVMERHRWHYPRARRAGHQRQRDRRAASAVVSVSGRAYPGSATASRLLPRLSRLPERRPAQGRDAHEHPKLHRGLRDARAGGGGARGRGGRISSRPGPRRGGGRRPRADRWPEHRVALSRRRAIRTLLRAAAQGGLRVPWRISISTWQRCQYDDV